MRRARIGAGRLKFRQRWAVLSAANIYGAIGEEVVSQAELAWDHRVHTSFPEKIGHVVAALKETMSRLLEPPRGAAMGPRAVADDGAHGWPGGRRTQHANSR